MRKPGFLRAVRKYKTEQESNLNVSTEPELRGNSANDISERRKSLRESTLRQSVDRRKRVVQRPLAIITPGVEETVPPTRSLTEEEVFVDAHNSSSSSEMTHNTTPGRADNYEYFRNENAEIATVSLFKGKSPLMAKELIDSIEQLRIKYDWDEERTIRIFGSKLKSIELKEWLLMVKNSSESNGKWETIKAAFERRFIKISKMKRWKMLQSLKQKRNESLEVFRGRMEKLVGPMSIVEEEKVTLFMMGLRKSYRRFLSFKKNFSSVTEVINTLLENEDFGNDSDYESDSEDSEQESESESESETDSDNEYSERRKKRSSKSKQKKKLMSKKKKKSSKSSNVEKELKEVRSQLSQLMKKSNTIFAINETRNNFNNDMKTTTGLDICGRCQRVGHVKINCTRKRMQCRACQMMGHIAPECRVKQRNNFNQPGRNNNSSNASNIVCFNCNQSGHFKRECPRLQQKSQGSNVVQNSSSVATLNE